MRQGGLANDSPCSLARHCSSCSSRDMREGGGRYSATDPHTPPPQLVMELADMVADGLRPEARWLDGLRMS